MRTIQVNLFSFGELNERAKEIALDALRGMPGIFGWDDEWRQSLEAFCDKFGVSYRGDGETSASNEHFRGLRLRDIDRDESLTGVSSDGDFLYPFCDEWKRSGSALVAFRHAISEGLRAWERDRENAYSDEGLAEFIYANDYEFTEDGELV